MAGKLKPYLSAGLIATGSVAVLALYAGDRWLEPMMPLLVGVVAILPLSIVGALLLHPEARSAPSRFLLLALTLVAGAVIGVGAPALWMLPDTRIAAIDHAFSMVDAQAALDDPSDKVKLHVCSKMIAGAAGVGEISQMLASRPLFANRCLQSAGGVEQANLVALNLQAAWHDELLADRAQGDPADEAQADQCVYSGALASLPVEAGSKQTDLLDCALRAPGQPQRTCCAKSLGALTDSCESLAAKLDAQKLIRSGAAGSLTAISFGEANAKREFAELTKHVDLSCKRMQLVSVQLSCLGLSSGGDGDRAHEALNWLLEESRGCLSEAEREQPALPADVCAGLMESIEQTGKIDRQMVCESHQQVIQEQQALLEDLKGLDSEESAALAAQIASGTQMAEDQRMSQETLMAIMRGDPGAPNLGSFTEAERKKFLEQAKANTPTAQEAVDGMMQNLAAAQAAYQSKLAGTEQVEKLREENPDLPSAEELEAQQKEANKKLESVHERFNNEMKRVEREKKRRSE